MRKIERYYRSAVFFGTLLLILGLIAMPVSAQTAVSATTTTGGDWTTTSPTPTWACSPTVSPCLPNNNSNDVFNVAVNGGNVTLDSASSPSNITIDSLSIAVGGDLNMRDGTKLTLAGTSNLTISGGLGVGAAGTTNGTTLNVGGSVTIASNMIVGGDSGGDLSNGVVNVGGTLDDTGGTLEITGGTTAGTPSEVSVSGPAPSTFEGAAYLFGGTGGAILNYGSGSITQIGGGGSNTTGEIILTGANASVEINEVGGNSALTTLANIASDGTLGLAEGAVVTTNSGVNLANAGGIFVGTFGGNAFDSTLNLGGSLTTSGTVDVGGTGSNGALNATSITNSGAVNIASTATVHVGTYTQTGGSTDVNGTLIAPTISVSGGSLTGAGSIQGNVTQTGGTFQPGDAPATITMTGNLTLSNSTYNEEIAGGTAGTGYSVLDVSGALDFGASDTLIPLDELSFNPSNGEMFDIINAASITGTFDNNNIAFDGGTFIVNYDTTGCASGSDCVVLTWNKPTGVTPEPASLLLFGTGLLGLAWMMRRRMKVGV